MESKNFDYKKLNAILEEKNITVEQLAKLTGKSEKAVRPWLNGTSTPHKSTLNIILRKLHISEERITKDLVPIEIIAMEKIEYAEKQLYDVLLPFYSYYVANLSVFEVRKKIKKLNSLGGYNGKSLNLANPDCTKVSLIKDMIPTINAMEHFVSQKDFPLNRMKNHSLGILVNLAKKVTRGEYENFDSHELYRIIVLKLLEEAEEYFTSSHSMLKLHKELVNNSLHELPTNNVILGNLIKIANCCVIIYNLFNLDNELIMDIIKNEGYRFPYTIKYYFTCYYDQEFSDTIVEFIDRQTNPANPENNERLTNYLNDSVKTIPDNILKQEYARRLLNDINKIVENSEVKQWIKDKYPKEKSKNSLIIKKFMERLIPLTDVEIYKLCINIFKENIDSYQYEVLVAMDELLAILKNL